MKSNHRIIKISKNRIFYTPDNSIGLDQTSLPTDDIRFRESKDIYWKAELLEFDKDEKSLLLKVVDYEPSDISVFEKQTAKDVVHLMFFEKLNWHKLEPLLSIYKKTALEPHIFEPEIILPDPDEEILFPKKRPRRSKEDETVQGTFFSAKHHDENLFDVAEEAQKPAAYTHIFKYNFKDAIFKLGHVLVKRKFAFSAEEVEIKIYNSDILPEYDLIKTFFPKAFGGARKFRVKASIRVAAGKVLEATGYSHEISAINEELIDSVKIRRTLHIPRATLHEGIDKSLFTADEVFDNVKDDGLDGNVFRQNADEILTIILEKRKVRNKKQLEYLAGFKHSPNTKIRFTLRPLFGFLFLIEGESMNHFCWELLNSHATYLWSLEKSDSLARQLKRIEETINLIRDSGRKAYKNAYRHNQLDTDILFNVIKHDQINSALVDGFVKWKHNLKEKLV